MYLLIITILMPLLVVSNANIDDLHERRCSVWDSACIKSNSQRLLPIVSAGLPDLGTRRLDPLRIPHLHFDYGGIRSDLDHIEMCGFSKAIIDKSSLDIYSKQVRVRFVIPTFTINATYVANGFLHSLPFNGKGDLYIRASDLEIDIIMDFDVREDGKGRKFMEFNKYFYSFDTTGGCSVLATNLNSGDAVQSEAVNTYLQNNWKAINAEYGRLYLDPFIDAVFKVIKDLMHADPLQNYFVDY